MLPRTFILVSHEPTQEKITRVICEIECDYQIGESQSSFWDCLQQADILFIAREDMPEPIADTVQTLRELPESPEVVIVVEREDDERRAEWLAAGCFAVIASSIPQTTLRATIEALVMRCQVDLESQLQIELDSEQPGRLSDFESTSPVMQMFMHTVKRVVQADSSLLVLGETGVGKERLARAIHDESHRGDKPFVPVNCAAFPESLLEGELFGHTEGAFTGASSDRRGCFEMAHGGTIFLDEIGEVPIRTSIGTPRSLPRG